MGYISQLEAASQSETFRSFVTPPNFAPISFPTDCAIMMDDRSNPESLFEFGANLLRRMGPFVRSHSNISIAEKSKFDYVTSLDISIQESITQSLRDTFTNDGIVSEEAPAALGSSDWSWALDPIDGTLNYASSIPFYTISLALFRRRDVFGAWVYDPLREEVFAAIRGSGARLNDRTLVLTETPGLDLPIGVTSAVLKSCAPEDPGIRLIDTLTNIGKLRCLGAQSLHLCYVAASRLSAAVAMNVKIWDDAAGRLIVEEAGGRYTLLGPRAHEFSLTDSAQNLNSVASSIPIHSMLCGTLSKFLPKY